MAMPTKKQLREFILSRFSEDEVLILCSDYFTGVENQFSINMSMSQKVIVLIDHCHRHGMVDNLIVALKQERPKQYQTEFAPAQSLKVAPACLSAWAAQSQTDIRQPLNGRCRTGPTACH
jgi:Effector-associated domain 7